MGLQAETCKFEHEPLHRKFEKRPYRPKWATRGGHVATKLDRAAKSGHGGPEPGVRMIFWPGTSGSAFTCSVRSFPASARTSLQMPVRLPNASCHATYARVEAFNVAQIRLAHLSIENRWEPE